MFCSARCGSRASKARSAPNADLDKLLSPGCIQGSNFGKSYTFRIKTITHQGQYAGTGAKIFVQFLVHGEWTEVAPYIESKVEPKEVVTVSYTTNERPTQIRISGQGADGWAFSECSIETDNESTVIISKEDGQWVKDSTVEFKVPISKFDEGYEFQIKTITHEGQYAGTGAKIMVQFMVDGEWTVAEPYIQSKVQPGDVTTVSYKTSKRPTRLKLSSPGSNDGWSFAECSIEPAVGEGGAVLAHSESGQWVKASPVDLLIPPHHPEFGSKDLQEAAHNVGLTERDLLLAIVQQLKKHKMLKLSVR